MHRLLPDPAGPIEPYDFYRLPEPASPHLRINVVTSADGHATDDRGVSGGLGGPGDVEVLATLRALADAIVVGAGTVRAEGYGAYRPRRALRARREADGRGAPAPIVIVSRALSLPPDAPVFTEAVTRSVVLTSAAASADRRRALAEVADVIVAGDEDVDLRAGLTALRERGLAQLLCEGGPTLNAQLLDAGLVDEVCVTVASQFVGGDGPGIANGLATPRNLALAGLLTDGQDLFTRYRVAAG